MRIVSLLPLLLAAETACDRITSASRGDASPDSLASLWEVVDAGPTNFNAVSGSSANNVVVVGDEGTILRWDGTALLRETSGTTANLRGVFVASDRLAYAVGERGTILRRQNGAWSADVPVTSATLNAVWSSDVSAAAVGEQGVALAFAKGVWTLIPNARNDNYYAITDSNDGLYVVGSQGVVSKVDIAKTSISADSIPGYTKLLSGAARWSKGAYFVGVEGGFFFYAAGKGTQTNVLGGPFLHGVDVAGGDVWVVGNQGFVAKLPGGKNPAVIPTPDDRWLVGVYASSASDLWIVGRSGAILRGPPGVRGRDGGVP